MILNCNEQETLNALKVGAAMKKDEQVAVISFEEEEPTQGNQGIESKEQYQNEQSMAKASGYYNVKRQTQPKQQGQSKKQQSKNQVLFDENQDVGEVGEWYDKTAKENQDQDDEFDVFDQEQQQQQQQQQQVKEVDYEENQQKNQALREKLNQKINQKGTTLAKRQGPIVNNLKQKAQMMALQNNTVEADNDNKKLAVIHSDEEEEHPKSNGYHSPNKQIFQLQENELERRLSEVEVWGKVNEEREVELKERKPREEMRKIVFIDAWDELKQRVKGKGSEGGEVGFFSRLFSCLRVELKSSKLVEERGKIIALAQMQYDDQEALHFQMLYTVYCTLMDTDFCQRYGAHWEHIGFQGRDPATDLRGAGMLGLLQMLAFLTNYKEYIQDCLGYSRQEMVSFPVCASLINVSTFCLACLKEDKLNGMINKEGSAMSVLNKLYFAGFYHFFAVYKKKQCNFHSVGPLLAETKALMLANASKLVQDFRRAIQLYYKNRSSE